MLQVMETNEKSLQKQVSQNLHDTLNTQTKNPGQYQEISVSTQLQHVWKTVEFHLQVT